MPDISIKQIDKTRSKENHSPTQSQITVELNATPSPDWIGAFNSGWKKTDLKVANEVVFSGKAVIVIRYPKATKLNIVYEALKKAVETTNETQSNFYSEIDAINNGPIRELLENLGEKGV